MSIKSLYSISKIVKRPLNIYNWFLGYKQRWHLFVWEVMLEASMKRLRSYQSTITKRQGESDVTSWAINQTVFCIMKTTRSVAQPNGRSVLSNTLTLWALWMTVNYWPWLNHPWQQHLKYMGDSMTGQCEITHYDTAEIIPRAHAGRLQMWA